MEIVRTAYMSRKRLGELRRLRRETDILTEQLMRLEREARFYRELPAAEGDTAREVREEVFERQRMERENYLRRKRILERETRSLLSFIESIPDSSLRQSFILRYLEGMTWQQISNRMNGVCADTLRIRHNRFLDEHSPHGKEASA